MFASCSSCCLILQPWSSCRYNEQTKIRIYCKWKHNQQTAVDSQSTIDIYIYIYSDSAFCSIALSFPTFWGSATSFPSISRICLQRCRNSRRKYTDLCHCTAWRTLSLQSLHWFRRRLGTVSGHTLGLLNTRKPGGPLVQQLAACQRGPNEA